LLREKFFKRKKGKKESAPPTWKENATQYFLRKILGLNFSATKLFLKTVYGLMLSAHFPDNRPLLSFFYFFLVPNLRLRRNQSGG